MTNSRKYVYNRKRFNREEKHDMRKKEKKESNRKIRRAPLELGCSRNAMKNVGKLYWDTLK